MKERGVYKKKFESRSPRVVTETQKRHIIVAEKQNLLLFSQNIKNQLNLKYNNKAV